MKTAWRYAREEKKRYVGIYTLFILASVVSAMNPLLYGWFINAVQKQGIDKLQYAWWYAGIFMLLKLAEWAFHGPARIMERQLAFNLSRNFLQQLYHQTLHLPVRWHQDHHSGATINRIRKAYEALKDFFQNGFMYLYTLTKFLSSFIAMIYFSPLFGAVGVLIGALTVYLIFRFDKPFMQAVDDKNEKEHIVSSTLFDSLSNIITVITLRLEKRMEGSVLQKVKDVFPSFNRSVKINEWKWFVADTLVSLIYVITAVGYIYQHTRPGSVFMLGSLVALLGFVNQFTSVFHDIAYQYTQVVQYNTDVQTARFITDAYQEHHLPESGSGLPQNWQTIVISGLNFSHKAAYSAAEKAHSLHGINISLQRGKRIAFIGESGSGKSTLMAVLRGLYDPEPGIRITVDDVLETDTARLAESITLFPQEPEIFENTIEHNITLGLPFDQQDIDDVCYTAHFTEVVKQLPNGLQSGIQEKGVNLSGGQKQRLALARGILAARSSEIVLLDEPTSSVDPKTEVQIYEKLFKACEGKAVVSTLHRLYLLTYFDYVYILKDGYIAGEGTFADLKQHSILFNELWKHQEKERDAV
ncbi:ABC transporter ATP-binding protein [Ferruginibacter paludis]|uniref:ABC transporter ATP-binding protein n=1 Tax=Ferruginibacter paludis TaxID=1310417 RepID=UPI0025B5CD46|nr:ABC transporter ATP-binding protein [Ferruginibacter paludis]MDN3657264.1 ABC transporter ATP-binding protein [Ferruginibacter paludis]